MGVLVLSKTPVSANTVVAGATGAAACGALALPAVVGVAATAVLVAAFDVGFVVVSSVLVLVPCPSPIVREGHKTIQQKQLILFFRTPEEVSWALSTVGSWPEA